MAEAAAQNEEYPGLPENMDEEQYNEFRDAFNIFDVDHSGTISVSELRKVLRAMGRDVSEQQVKDMMNEVDKDGNNEIDFIEFVNLMQRQMKEPNKADEYKSAFTCFDRENSQKVIAAELTGIIEKLGTEQGAEVIDLLNQFADADGNINYIEMIAKLTGEQ